MTGLVSMRGLRNRSVDGCIEMHEAGQWQICHLPSAMWVRFEYTAWSCKSLLWWRLDVSSPRWSEQRDWMLICCVVMNGVNIYIYINKIRGMGSGCDMKACEADTTKTT